MHRNRSGAIMNSIPRRSCCRARSTGDVPPRRPSVGQDNRTTVQDNCPDPMCGAVNSIPHRPCCRRRSSWTWQGTPNLSIFHDSPRFPALKCGRGAVLSLEMQKRQESGRIEKIHGKWQRAPGRRFFLAALPSTLTPGLFFFSFFHRLRGITKFNTLLPMSLGETT